ncbi:hypothetical protein XAP6164_90008 [Xanthomonas phaseoli pv. phaseoli]|nr:hypothetical protein XAP6164_90008 [Xanthomonas phaseoli pv. phaseoli]
MRVTGLHHSLVCDRANVKAPLRRSGVAPDPTVATVQATKFSGISSRPSVKLIQRMRQSLRSGEVGKL